MNPKRVNKAQRDDVKAIEGLESNVELLPRLGSSLFTSN